MFKYVFSILLFIIVLRPTLISADDHEDLISGVINAISIDDNGNVEAVSYTHLTLPTIYSV